MNAREDLLQPTGTEGKCGRDLLSLNLAVADYDRTRPLIEGHVQPEGIALKVNTAWIGDFCVRPVYEEYDAAEFSLSWYVAARTRGEPVVALPVFPLRMPVLAYMFCRSDAPYSCPADLIGKKIAAPCYRFTVNLWLRGMLKEHFGLAPEQMEWYTGAPEGAGYVPPANVKITLMPGAKPEELLERGAVDAIMVPVLPKPFIDGEIWIRRLFRDCRAETRSFVTRTGIHPITHTVVMKQSLFDKHPWAARSLANAFVASQRATDDFYARDPKHLGLSEAVFCLEEERSIYGRNRWSHGIEGPNRKVLETFVRYAHEQGYITRRPALEELFPMDLTGN